MDVDGEVMDLTLVEKIAPRHADGLADGSRRARGRFRFDSPRHVMTHDNTGAVIPKVQAIGAHRDRGSGANRSSRSITNSKRHAEEPEKYANRGVRFANTASIITRRARHFAPGDGGARLCRSRSARGWRAIRTPIIRCHWRHWAHQSFGPMPPACGPREVPGGRCPRWRRWC